MTRTNDRKTLGVLAVLALSAFWVGESPGQESAKPNVIVVVANDLSWDDLPRHGEPEIETPAIDRLAEEGMELQRFYVAPAGAATRASLLTGRYFYRTGVSGQSNGENVMLGHEITLAEVLRENGYATACFGVWENGRNWPSNASGQGFDTVVDAGTAGELAAAALEFCSATREAPFFCWLAFPRTLQGGGLAVLDKALGELLEGLDATGQADDCLLVFVADNGSGGRTKVGGNGEGADGAPRPTPRLFGGLGSVHEGGVRVPFMVRWPGKIPAKSESHEISAAIDLLPTVIELTGSDFIETLPLDGISLAELLTTGGKPRRWPNRILFTAFTPPGYAVKQASVAVRTGRWLAVRDPRTSRAASEEDRDDWELYDMHGDPYQRYNVADEYWYLAGHLSADFSFWMKYTTENGLAPIPTEVGHVEWPVVTLHVDDAPFNAEDLLLANMPSHRSWPIEVVESGGYRVSIAWRGMWKVEGCELRVAAGEAELSVKVETPPGGFGGVTEMGSLHLEKGITELTAEIRAGDGALLALPFEAVLLERVEEESAAKAEARASKTAPE